MKAIVKSSSFLSGIFGITKGAEGCINFGGVQYVSKDKKRILA